MSIEERIAELKRLRAAATHDEWLLREDDFADDIGYVEPTICANSDSGLRTVATIRIGLQESMSNGEFIAYAANNAIAIIDELQAELQLGRFKDFRKRLESELTNPEFFGCFTGDCPHDQQSQCDIAIQDWIIQSINESDEIAAKEGK